MLTCFFLTKGCFILKQLFQIHCISSSLFSKFSWSLTCTLNIVYCSFFFLFPLPPHKNYIMALNKISFKISQNMHLCFDFFIKSIKTYNCNYLYTSKIWFKSKICIKSKIWFYIYTFRISNEKSIWSMQTKNYLFHTCIIYAVILYHALLTLFFFQ